MDLAPVNRSAMGFKDSFLSSWGAGFAKVAPSRSRGESAGEGGDSSSSARGGERDGHVGGRRDVGYRERRERDGVSGGGDASGDGGGGGKTTIPRAEFNASDGKYHSWVCVLSNRCGINSWFANSEVVHAVADSPYGPYVHNPPPLHTHTQPSFRSCQIVTTQRHLRL
jgi:hypothetical protein